jgi:hypothetical protein
MVSEVECSRVKNLAQVFTVQSCARLILLADVGGRRMPSASCGHATNERDARLQLQPFKIIQLCRPLPSPPSAGRTASN